MNPPEITKVFEDDAFIAFLENDALWVCNKNKFVSKKFIIGDFYKINKNFSTYLYRIKSFDKKTITKSFCVQNWNFDISNVKQYRLAFDDEETRQAYENYKK